MDIADILDPMTDQQPTLYMDAVLRPNRSMSPAAFGVIIAVTGMVSFGAGILFLYMGAFPVIGFLGLDALAIWIGFRTSFRRQRMHTHIRVSADRIDLHHYEPGQSPRSASLPTAFARVDLIQMPRRDNELRLSHGRRSWVVGRFLTCAERRSLCNAITTAIVAARGERHPSQIPL
jgi:uncharacterized membrane protein